MCTTVWEYLWQRENIYNTEEKLRNIDDKYKMIDNIKMHDKEEEQNYDDKEICTNDI